MSGPTSTMRFAITGRPDAYPGVNETQRLKWEVEDLRNRLNTLADPDEHATSSAAVTKIEKAADGTTYIWLYANGTTLRKKAGKWEEPVRVGMQAQVRNDLALPVAYDEIPAAGCPVVNVDRVHDGFIEFTRQSAGQAAACDLHVKVGDRVMLDPMGAVVIRNLGGGAAKAFTAETGVSWDDIGGLEDVKRRLREAIEEPVLHREVHARYGKRPCKGILLAGPPGTGKSMLAKACATSLATLHGKSARSSGLLYVSGPELLHGIVGSSEANVRKMFDHGRSHFAEHGYPCVIVLDEAEALLGVRGQNPWEGIERSVVPQFLAEMDGFQPTNSLLLLATNRPEAIDPAVLRPGRIDLQIHVPYVDRAAAIDILRIHLRGKPAAVENLAELAVDEVWSSRHVIRVETLEKGKGRERFILGDCVGGAMLAGIVDQATQAALRRAIAGDDTGITLADVKAAVADVVAVKSGKTDAGKPTVVLA